MSWNFVYLLTSGAIIFTLAVYSYAVELLFLILKIIFNSKFFSFHGVKKEKF